MDAALATVLDKSRKDPTYRFPLDSEDFSAFLSSFVRPFVVRCCYKSSGALSGSRAKPVY